MLKLQTGQPLLEHHEVCIDEVEHVTMYYYFLFSDYDVIFNKKRNVRYNHYLEMHDLSLQRALCPPFINQNLKYRKKTKWKKKQKKACLLIVTTFLDLAIFDL